MARPESSEVAVVDSPRGKIWAFTLTPDQLEGVKAGDLALPGGEDCAAAASHLAMTRFAAESGETQLLPRGDGGWLAVGIGKSQGPGVLRRASAAAAEAVPGGEEWSFWLAEAASPGDAEELAEGTLLAGYRTRGVNDPVAGHCSIVAPALTDAERGRASKRAQARVRGVVLARDLTNAPASDLGPGELADAALDLAKRHGLSSKCLRGSELDEAGLGLITAVGKASSRAPTFTVLEHRLEGRSPEIALVGKGVVFDTGGVDLKPPDAMLLMRKDMAGAGTVLGVMEAVAELELDLPLLAVIPSAENSLGPDAYRPGDVLNSLDGLSVEIGNTDAEGRLLLADGLTYSRRQGARRLLDLATLTGAARIALGTEVGALFGNDEELVAELLSASSREDEVLWRLPLVDSYDTSLDTPFADVNHISLDRRGGAITAALFLRRFTRETPWAHIDMFGWEEHGSPGFPKGASGAGVRTVVEALIALESSKNR